MYIIKKKSTKINNWGNYNCWVTSEGFFITKKSAHKLCKENPNKFGKGIYQRKEKVIAKIPEFEILKIMKKKHLDSRFLSKYNGIWG